VTRMVKPIRNSVNGMTASAGSVMSHRLPTRTTSFCSLGARRIPSKPSRARTRLMEPRGSLCTPLATDYLAAWQSDMMNVAAVAK